MKYYFHLIDKGVQGLQLSNLPGLTAEWGLEPISYSKLTPNLNYAFYVGSSEGEDKGPKNKAKYIRNYKKEIHMRKMKTSFKSRQTFKTSILVKMEHEEGGRQTLYQ